MCSALISIIKQLHLTATSVPLDLYAVNTLQCETIPDQMDVPSAAQLGFSCVGWRGKSQGVGVKRLATSNSIWLIISVDV